MGVLARDEARDALGLSLPGRPGVPPPLLLRRRGVLALALALARRRDGLPGDLDLEADRDASGEPAAGVRPRFFEAAAASLAPAPRLLSGLEASDVLLERRRRIGERGSGQRVGTFLSSTCRK